MRMENLARAPLQRACRRRRRSHHRRTPPVAPLHAGSGRVAQTAHTPRTARARDTNVHPEECHLLERERSGAAARLVGRHGLAHANHLDVREPAVYARGGRTLRRNAVLPLERPASACGLDETLPNRSLRVLSAAADRRSASLRAHPRPVQNATAARTATG